MRVYTLEERIEIVRKDNAALQALALRVINNNQKEST